MSFTKTTEQDSNYNHLEKMSISELLKNINNEDKAVPIAVEKALPQVEALVLKIVKKLNADGVDITRRTVAKYRQGLRIPTSNARRRLARARHRAKDEE